MIYAVEDHAYIAVSASKSHKHRDIVADARALDTSETDANGNAQMLKKAY